MTTAQPSESTRAGAQPREKSLRDPGAQFLLTAASVVIIVAGLKLGAELLRPIIMSLFLAVVSMPVLSWLRRKGLPVPAAVLVTMLVVLVALSSMIALVGSSVASFTERAPEYQERLVELTTSVEDWLVVQGMPRESVALRQLIRPRRAMDYLVNSLSTVAEAVSGVTLVLLTTVFALFEAVSFESKARRAFHLPPDQPHPFSNMLREIQQYLGIKTVVSLGTGLLIGMWCGLWHLEFYVLWGLVAFVLNYIPSIGSIIAAIPAVLLSLLQQGPTHALIIAAGYIAVNFAFGNFLEPSWLGRRLGLSTLVVMLSLIFWGWAWGPVGMLLSVPLTMVVKILLQNTKDLRWLAVLLGNEPQEPEGEDAAGELAEEVGLQDLVD